MCLTMRLQPVRHYLKSPYDYYRSGANDEITLHENHTAYERIKLKPRVLQDISKRDLTTTVLGQTVSMPILVALRQHFTLWHILRVKWRQPALPARLDTIMILSTLSTKLNRRSHVAGYRSRVVSTLCLQRSRSDAVAGPTRPNQPVAAPLLLTVDAQIWGRRERDIKNRFRLPEGPFN